MGALSRLCAFVAGGGPSVHLAARRRHHQTGELLWTEADRHVGPAGERWVVDVTPGTPDHIGSVRVTRDDRREVPPSIDQSDPARITAGHP